MNINDDEIREQADEEKTKNNIEKINNETNNALLKMLFVVENSKNFIKIFK